MFTFKEYLTENIDWDLVKKKGEEVHDFLKWHGKTHEGSPNLRPYDCNELEGYCSNASLFLRKHLAKHGIQSKFVTGTHDGFDHSWLHVGNKIVDITAKQFSNKHPKVRIVDQDHPDYDPEKEDFKAIKFVKKNWPKEQSYNKPLRNLLSQRFNKYAPKS